MDRNADQEATWLREPPLADAPIRVDGGVSLEEGKELLKLLVPRHRRVMVYTLVFGAGYLVLAALRLPFPMAPLCLATFIACFFFLLSRLQRRAYENRQGLYAPRVLEFSIQGVRVATNQCETHWNWQAFRRVRSTPRFLLLELAPAQGCLVVARSWCSDDEQWSQLGRLVCSRVRDAEEAAEPADARQFRAKRLAAEAHLKQSTLGLTAAYLVLALVVLAVPLSHLSGPFRLAWITMGVIAAVAGVAACVVSLGVIRLAASSRGPLTALAVLGLLYFPLGTVFAAQILRIIYGGPDPKLLSPQYELLVRRSGPMSAPRARRTGVLTWVALGVIVLIVVLVIIISQLPPEFRLRRG